MELATQSLCFRNESGLITGKMLSGFRILRASRAFSTSDNSHKRVPVHNGVPRTGYQGSDKDEMATLVEIARAGEARQASTPAQRMYVPLAPDLQVDPSTRKTS